MGLLRRREPLHRRLAEAGDMLAGLELPRQPPPGQPAEPPSWDGEARGEAGIHGVPRARRWDAVATVDAPGLKGDRLHLISLADGTLVVEEDEPDGALAPFADAVDRVLTAPYRAEAVRRGGDTWAVAATRIELVHVPGLVGDEVELAATREGRTMRIDGQTTLGRAAELERVGEAQGTEYVVRARRVDGDLWEVEASPL